MNMMHCFFNVANIRRNFIPISISANYVRYIFRLDITICNFTVTIRCSNENKLDHLETIIKSVSKNGHIIGFKTKRKFIKAKEK